MAKYKIKESFKGSPDGMEVIEYTKGETDIELTGELEKVAVEEKWVTKMRKTASANSSDKSEAANENGNGKEPKKEDGSENGSNAGSGSETGTEDEPKQVDGLNTEGSTEEVGN